MPTTTIFFYGLFMDQALLTGKGFSPEYVGPAVLPDYHIHIGNRATLVRSPSSKTYGIAMRLRDEEALDLYAEPSVSDYAAEDVRIELLETGELVAAVCYNLPADGGLEGTNPVYAMRLAELVTALGFEASYAREIAAFGGAIGPRT
ncbi:MAG: gamma-glutamylcyclotransferase [Rhodothermales bacterium]|nr:gamma-glutamylcyclotransferase [Rhodothermales bacterium]